MERKYRIKANVGEDKVLNVQFRQDIDLYEILSLSISNDSINSLKRENAYKLFSSDYGVVIGRVLANDAFGVPNAKVSVFIPISEQDKLRTDIKDAYPFSFVTDYNKDNIRYNTLPKNKVSECHTPVGTFPDKRYMLDNDTVLEIYDKYYKYTTVTNSAGDYMIFGVPVGEQIIHTDIDLSDIGVLSQKPSDFLSKGYTETMFESSSKFKKSTNLDDLAQIFSDNTTVTVYPFWGDSDTGEIAITRKDIRLQYKFETSCIFFGSVITDNPNNSVSHKCVPDINIGDASQLMTSSGKIEMIRKVAGNEDVVEEYAINSNNLIDSDGVFCYQIPMNLDYVGTDEYGNIVPTDNPKKGIPTRSRVRFRITLDESGSEAATTHKARYLIPNNPDLKTNYVEPHVASSAVTTDDYYQFGTLTPDECFRDMYWNKVYSVKCYIPRIQLKNEFEEEQNYLAIKGVNKKTASSINPIPYNKINLNFSIPAYAMLERMFNQIEDDAESDESEHDYGEDDDRYFRRMKWKLIWNYVRGNYNNYRYDSIREAIVADMDAIGLDFYNDWLNGCLYFPNWYWYTNNTYSDRKEFCECSVSGNGIEENICVVNTGSLLYSSPDMEFDPSYISDDESINKEIYGSQKIYNGIIRKIVNKDNAEIFYYAFGDGAHNEKNDSAEYVRLFSTDLILLGSTDDNDFQGVPKVSKKLPATTCTIPPIGIYKRFNNIDDESDLYDEIEVNNISSNGMNWGSYWDQNGKSTGQVKDYAGYRYKYGNGLFFGIVYKQHCFKIIHSFWPFTACRNVIGANTNEKTYPNLERICELGVMADCDYELFKEKVGVPDWVKEREEETGRPQRYVDVDRYNRTVEMDGFITRREIIDPETRSLFATLNSNKLVGEKYDEKLGYRKYNLYYLYPTSFDGRLDNVAKDFTNYEVSDYRSRDYIDFRFGATRKQHTETSTSMIAPGSIYKHYYYTEDGKFGFPVYENSFYFYFGLNPGKTAIDKFYSKYMEECIDADEANPFAITISNSDASYCEKTAVETVKLDGYFSIPVTVELKKVDGAEINVVSSVTTNSNIIEFKNLEWGDYEITATDSRGHSVTEKDKIIANMIALDVVSERKITTEYVEGEEELICDTDNYGVIKFVKYYDDSGNSHNIEYLERTTNEQGDGPEIATYFVNDENIIIKISGDSGNIEDCLCKNENDDYIFVENDVLKIHVKKPQYYYFTIVDKRVDGCQNLSINSISMSASDALVMNVDSISFKYFGKSFYDSSNDVEDVSNINGWFFVNDPNKYTRVFNSIDSADIFNVWEESEPMNVVNKKLKRLFNISQSTFITNETHTFKVNVPDGNYTLIRCVHPIYENVGNGYIFTNKGEVTACNDEPNIIPSSDYSEFIFNNDVYETDQDGLPLAGNYFACFDQNANIVQEGVDTCTFNSEAKGFSKLPDKTDSFYILRAPGTAQHDIWCTGRDNTITRNSLYPYAKSVYKHDDSYNPYFRTEFIDRRLGYELAYFTPTKFESDNDNDWNKARISGYTYNGIEMGFDAVKRLANHSDNDDLDETANGASYEYYYDEESGYVALGQNEKSLYSSTIKIGRNSGEIDITKAYVYQKRTEPILNTDKITGITHPIADITGKEFYNYGSDENLDGNGVPVPTKRLLDINIAPKDSNESYYFNATSCSYNIQQDDMANATVKAGESVEYEFFDGSIETALPDVGYNVSGTVQSNTFVPQKFVLKLVNGTYGDESNKFTEWCLIIDDRNHTEYKKLKTDPNLTLSFSPISWGSEITKSINPGYDSYAGVVLKQEIIDSEMPLKKVIIYDASLLYDIQPFTLTATRGVYTSKTRTLTRASEINTRGCTTISFDVPDGEGGTTTITKEICINSTGTRAAEGETDIYYIELSFSNTNVSWVEGKINNYSKNDSEEFSTSTDASVSSSVAIIATNLALPGDTIEIEVYATIGDLVYYFKTNVS